ncbi:MAG: hypothetical protein UV73_C0022G0007 [Candidatus Gottesmanbacteria bacterium GW2011_GWA2_43_14]|uniref:Uncharacterized protein n=1 Tax=Candidatus Gottesmanbacteria bacterium GW2011_GWA2_43_14 TaxID=1618443 RepID=A0A0G1G884_9BACT|nr:MAG: hypothetical protein UV73_C0022G0007 [Candidatus Gottesmanbacteria bacterium GW2011_GWA2_43_14]
MPIGRSVTNGRWRYTSVIPYKGDDSWVEGTILKAIDCLKSDTIPAPNADCDYCRYRKAVREVE